jgi:hypothetical protein
LVTAMEHAMQKVGLTPEKLAQWAADDKVHVDPPMGSPEPPPPPQKFGDLHPQAVAQARQAIRPATAWASGQSPWASPAPTTAPPAPAPESPAPDPTPNPHNTETEQMELSLPSGEEPMDHAITKEDPQRPSPTHAGKYRIANPKEIGVTEASFLAVRDNPGELRRDLIKALAAAGYNYSSLSAIFAHLVRAKVVRADRDGHLFAKRRHFPRGGLPQRDTLPSAKQKKARGQRKMSKSEVGRLGGLARAARAAGARVAQADMREGAVPRRVTGHVLTKAEAGRYANYVRWGAKRDPNFVKPTVEEFKRMLMKNGGVTPKPGQPVVKPGRKRDLDQAHRRATTTKGNSSSRTLDTERGRTDPTPRSMDDLLDTMSVTQARRLFERLKHYFKD